MKLTTKQLMKAEKDIINAKTITEKIENIKMVSDTIKDKTIFSVIGWVLHTLEVLNSNMVKNYGDIINNEVSISDIEDDIKKIKKI